jgi:hypothetical protein
MDLQAYINALRTPYIHPDELNRLRFMFQSGTPAAQDSTQGVAEFLNDRRINAPSQMVRDAEVRGMVPEQSYVYPQDRGREQWSTESYAALPEELAHIQQMRKVGGVRLSAIRDREAKKYGEVGQYTKPGTVEYQAGSMAPAIGDTLSAYINRARLQRITKEKL